MVALTPGERCHGELVTERGKEFEMITALYEVELCSCCAVLAANDDTSGCTGSHTHPLLSQLKLRAGECLVVTGEESFFTNARCDGCGSPAGDRLTGEVIGPDLPSDNPDEHMACRHAEPIDGGFCTETPDGVPA